MLSRILKNKTAKLAILTLLILSNSYIVVHAVSGGLVWARRFNGKGSDYMESLASDSYGVYYAGSSNFGSNEKMTIVKYSHSGVRKWNKFVDGPFTNGSDSARGITSDNKGNIYVAGDSDGVNGNTQVLIIKYNKYGDIVWKKRYSSSKKLGETVKKIYLKGSYLYIVGTIYRASSENDYLILKYNLNGTLIWAKTYDNMKDQDWAFDVVVDDNGNVYVTGGSEGFDGSYDFATIKLNKYGVSQWVSRYPGINAKDDSAIGIVRDSNNNIYVAGTSSQGPNLNDYTLIKYNSSGQEKWVQLYNGSDGGNDLVTDIAISKDNSIYITGISEGLGTNSDYATIKYDVNGNEKWVRRYSHPSNMNDAGKAVAVDSYNNVYVTGRSIGYNGSKGFLTIKYNKTGTEKWKKRFSSPLNDNSVNAMAIDGSNRVYVGGMSYTGASTDDDLQIVRYSP